MGDLGATYDDHLRLVEKRVGDFLLVLIELFSLDRTAEALSVSQVPSTNHHILHISIVQMYGTMTGHKTMPQKFTKSVS